ncbi:GNAT family N-acetyltransferase [Halalkalibacterium halodurans]|uniref:GNAT family N-acetyltransferase n=1 Tax=Halalkalibacterium halodurans TaxID=86665 RepID=UPI00141A4A20|nr:GNAT family N-acetyltransferase [Halalkalibacterium halodurans]
MIVKELDNEEFLKCKDAILDLLTETYIENFGISKEQSISLCKEKLNLIPNYINQKTAILIGTYEDERLVGFLWLYKHEFFGESRLHINQIIVSNKFRGKGIGRRLMKQAEQVAKKHKISTIDLNVSEVNKEAVRMYNSMGFITERRYMKKVF